MITPRSTDWYNQGLITLKEHKILFEAEFYEGINLNSGMKCAQCSRKYTRVIDIEFMQHVGICASCDHYNQDAWEAMHENYED